MSSTDRNPSPSPSTKLPSKLRLGRKKGGNVSTPSLESHSISNDSDSPDRRLSVESVLDKLKPGSRRPSDDNRLSIDGSRLSKLMSSKLKRRKSDQSATAERPTSDFLSTEPFPDVIGRHSNDPSEQSIGLAGSSRSSLLTDDSQEPTGGPSRPSLEPRDSHAGYLTLSSPLIKARTPDSTAQDSSSIDPVTTAHTGPTIEEAPVSSEEEGYSYQVGKGPDTVAGSESSDLSTVTPSKASRKSARLSNIDTTGRPQTPPNLTPTPSTFVTPPTPIITQTDSPPKKSSTPRLAFQSSSPPGLSLGFKSRPKSSILAGSKLSNTINANPLTPTIEEAKTPGGTLSQPSGSGFFSNWVSVAQNAANTFSSTFNQTGSPGQRSRQVTDIGSSKLGSEEVFTASEAQPAVEAEEVSPLAIETLGQGDLNLGHLGITDNVSPMSSATDLAAQGTLPTVDISLKAEEDAAARAVSVAYEKPIISAISQATGGRPASVVSGTDGVEHSPPRNQNISVEAAADIKRSGSVRSRISDRRQRRHRASSATTGGTFGVPPSTVNSITTNGAVGGSHKLTGFAVASSKRNKDFHQLFRSVPEDDYLIEDYSAALQRDILLHGRFYVSEGHICFSSNILGWVTNLVIAFDEIVSIEKKNTAIVFPNALVIQTLHARNTFASFVARDSTYDLLLGIWKTSHPNLKIEANGVSLANDGALADRGDQGESPGSEEGSDDDSDDVYDEYAEDGDDFGSFTEGGANGSIAGTDIGDTLAIPRKASTLPMSSNPAASTAPKGLENADAVVTGAAVSADFPGPPLHEATECSDGSTHYDKPLIDITIPAPLGKIYSMMFGPASGAFMKKWLVEDQKSKELLYEDDKIGMDEAHKTFTYSYIKPLNAPVGPRQTKCIVTCNLLAYDLEKAVSIDCSTATPDVPSGSIFTTKTRYCIMWGPGNTTRMIANCTIEWTGKSWLKGPIEKGANDGQTQYVKDWVAALKAAVTTKPPVRGQVRGKVGKGKRRKETFDTAGTEAELAAADKTKTQQEESWGLLEPIRPLADPLVSIIKPYVSLRMIVAFLLFYIFFIGPRRSAPAASSSLSVPQRMAAYEAMWQREEAELWDWLEDRVGLNNVMMSSQRDAAKSRQKGIKTNTMAKKLKQEGTSTGNIGDAIRETEEKLQALKDAHARKQELK